MNDSARPTPDGLRWLAAKPGGDRWLRELPARVECLAQRWDLEIGEPFATGHVSWVAQARRAGADVVLKVQWPHPECEHEAAALRCWDGDGAVRLLAHDEHEHALLLERCTPGTHLAAEPKVALDALVDLLPRLWVAPDGPFTPARVEAAGWLVGLHDAWEQAGRPCERRLVDAARRALEDVLAEPGPQVLVHQDLHGDNVLAARRRPWLAIDPKPLAGDRELSVAPIVRSFELGDDAAATRRRLDHLTAELGLDRDRARAWTVGQTMAWSFDSTWMATHHQTCRWLLDDAP